MSKHKWQPMKLAYIGTVAEALRGGSGKLSLTGGDPGDTRKQQGNGG